MVEDVDVELGQKVQDNISGFTGIVTTIGEHLTGCTRIGVRPVGEEQTARRGDEEFFFDAQLTVIEAETAFTEQGEKAHTETAFDLGKKVEDTVTGFEGVVVVINFSLFNCPTLAVRAVDNTDATESSDIEWFDAPRLQSTGEGVVAEFDEVQTTEAVEATGPVADAAPSLDKP